MYEYRSMQTAQAKAVAVNAFLRGVYGWMSAGLCLTAAAALFTAQSPTVQQAVFGNPILFFGLIIAQLGVVVALSAAINRLSAATATALFVGYSLLTGLTLSSIFLVYTTASIFNTFVVCAGMFAAMSVYGAVTKKDLTAFGSFLFMGLIGIVIASLVNLFLRISALDFAISAIGVLVFTGLTAYDTQKLKTMGETAPQGDALAIRRGTILGALTLYLDFINLFLMLLRFMGTRRD